MTHAQLILKVLSFLKTLTIFQTAQSSLGDILSSHSTLDGILAQGGPLPYLYLMERQHNILSLLRHPESYSL